MNDRLKQLIRQATLYTDDRQYHMLHLALSAAPAAASFLAEHAAPFSTLIVDKDEVTLIIAAEQLDHARAALPPYQTSSGYRLLTFDLPLEHDLVGFMAVISTHLADAGIALMAISAFERDHLLISTADFDRAVQVITQLQATI
jgi:hypothetical protein